MTKTLKKTSLIKALSNLDFENETKSLKSVNIFPKLLK